MPESRRYSLAILIAGPLMDWDEHNVELINRIAPNTVVIGNGKRSIVNADNKSGELFDVLENMRLRHPNFFSGKILIYMATHGAPLDNRHVMNFRDPKYPHDLNIWYPTEAMFKLISKELNAPVDIIFFPCSSNYAVQDVKYLPKNSSAIMQVGDIIAAHKTNEYFLNLYNLVELFNLKHYYDNLLKNLATLVAPIIVTYRDEQIITLHEP